MIIRAEHKEDFTTMSNHHLRDKNLSLKAKGLLSWALSCSDNWVFSTAGMIEVMKESRDAIKATLKELEIQGYLKREDIKLGGKYNGTNFIFYELPQTDNPPTVSQTDNPSTENPQLINTNSINTNVSKKVRNEIKEAEPETKRVSYEELIKSLVENETVQKELLKYVLSKCDKGNYLKNPQVEALVKQLIDLSKDPKEQIKIISQSLAGGYKTFFPLKSTKKPRANKEIKKYNDGAIMKPFNPDNLARDEDGNLIVF